MISSSYTLKRYDADEGNVFDWKNLDEHIVEVDGEKVQEHLYAKTIFLSASDTIDNYIEIEKPEQGSIDLSNI